MKWVIKASVARGSLRMGCGRRGGQAGFSTGVSKRAVNVKETHKDVQKGDSLHRTT